MPANWLYAAGVKYVTEDCPFCASGNLSIEVRKEDEATPSHRALYVRIECHNCHCTGPEVDRLFAHPDPDEPTPSAIIGEAVEVAVGKWNRARGANHARV